MDILANLLIFGRSCSRLNDSTNLDCSMDVLANLLIFDARAIDLDVQLICMINACVHKVQARAAICTAVVLLL